MTASISSDDLPWVVVGGGVAGLVTAVDLARSGRPVVVLEAGTELGGAVARHRVGELDLDAGAESFATTTAAVTGLITELGLTDQLVVPHALGAWVRHEGGTAPLPAAALLGIPSRPWAPDTRRLLGAGGAARAQLDRALPAWWGARRSTLGGLVRARMGDRVVRRLVEPVAGGVYGTDPDLLEVLALQPQMPAALARAGSLSAAVGMLRGSAAPPGAAVSGLRGGVFTLVQALESAIRSAGGQIHRSMPVSSIDTDLRVHTTAGPLSAGRVVLAVDGRSGLVLLRPLVPAVPAAELPRAPAGDVLLITLVVHSPALNRAPRGTGVLVANGTPGITAKALTHGTAKWAWLAEQAGPDTHVLRLSYGRTGDAALPDPEAAVELARRDAQALLGVPLRRGAVLATAARRWTAALPTPGVGHAKAVATLRAALPTGVTMTGAHLAGTGLAAVVADARRTAAALIGGTRIGGQQAG